MSNEWRAKMFVVVLAVGLYGLTIGYAPPPPVENQADLTILKSEIQTNQLHEVSGFSALVESNNVFAIETVIRTGNTNQSGPARIVSISQDTGHRNFTLGQSGSALDVRIRTDVSNQNGNPSLEVLDPQFLLTHGEWTHVVYAKRGDNSDAIFVNGELAASRDYAGFIRNWETNYPLVLMNEVTGDRPWIGEIQYVRLWADDFTPEYASALYIGWRDHQEDNAGPVTPPVPGPIPPPDRFLIATTAFLDIQTGQIYDVILHTNILSRVVATNGGFIFSFKPQSNHLQILYQQDLQPQTEKYQVTVDLGAITNTFTNAVILQKHIFVGRSNAPIGIITVEQIEE